MIIRKKQNDVIIIQKKMIYFISHSMKMSFSGKVFIVLYDYKIVKSQSSVLLIISFFLKKIQCPH